MNLLKRNAALSLVAVTFLTGCASNTVSRYKPDAYSNISSWSVKLAYEAGEVAQAVKGGEVVETTISRSGNSSTELTLREDIYFYLKDHSSINVSPNGEGQILISVDGRYVTGGIVAVTVRLTDSSGAVLSRMKIKNGEGGGYKKIESFTAYVGDAIIDEISTRR